MKKTLRNISIRKRKSRHGFLRRMSARGGRSVLRRRRRKGRRRLLP